MSSFQLHGIFNVLYGLDSTLKNSNTFGGTFYHAVFRYSYSTATVRLFQSLTGYSSPAISLSWAHGVGLPISIRLIFGQKVFPRGSNPSVASQATRLKSN